MILNAYRYLFTGTACLLLLLTAALDVETAQAETTFSDANFYEELVTDNIVRASTIEFAPDGRLFILEQTGDVRIVKDGVLLPTPFLSLTEDDGAERGLLGIAFDPNFLTNQYVYFYYTTTEEPERNRVSRFTADGDVAMPNSEVIITELDPLSEVANNHNGGTIKFGLDGTLFIAVGDGGEIAQNSQDLTNRFGKLLRINADGTIPENNPFYDTLTGDNRAIWAYGLRNPFTFDVQPGTGLVYINDVGQGTWEEINIGLPGANYGWPDSEGPTDNPSFTAPIYTYEHIEENNNPCAITGGTFYNPPTASFPAEYVGDYFFMDYCGDWIWRYDIQMETVTPFAEGIQTRSVDITVGPDGALYYASRVNRGVYRIFYSEAADYDLNLDGNITPEDAVAVTNRIGQEPTGDNLPYDVDGDNDIDDADVNTVIGAIGQSVPVPPN